MSNINTKEIEPPIVENEQPNLPPSKRRLTSSENENEEEEEEENPLVLIKTPFKKDINYVDFEAERDILNLSIIQYVKSYYEIEKEDNSNNDVQVKINVSFKLLKKMKGKRKVISFRKNILQTDYNNIYSS